jgi:hypothetical protein
MSATERVTRAGARRADGGKKRGGNASRPTGGRRRRRRRRSGGRTTTDTRDATEDSGGDGPAVILAHGFLMDHEMFAPQVAALAPQYRVITWDERGFGLTEHDGKPFTYWDSAADCLGLLDHLGGFPLGVADLQERFGVGGGNGVEEWHQAFPRLAMEESSRRA